MKWPKLGRAGEAWPGIVLTGVVTLAAAVLADSLGEPPAGGPRFYVGLVLGLVLLALGYGLRWWERRRNP